MLIELAQPPFNLIRWWENVVSCSLFSISSSGSDYDSSSSSEYEHKIAYTYDQDYTAISEESYDTDDFDSSGDDAYIEPIKPNELVSDGPQQEARPSHPAHPDQNGLADILTDPNTVQVGCEYVVKHT